MPRLEWDGKKAVENYHLQVPYHVLWEDSDLSCGGDAGEGNLLVQGDNLVALKALLPYYRGQVKCIYIDPPYNTGNEGWLYNDNVNSPIIKEWFGRAVGKDAEDFSRHDKWLCMMYPRLKLLREFLREDGTIFVSLDDNEGASFKLLMDEVFGASNFVASVIWQKRTSPEARLGLGAAHDYIFVYGKRIDKVNFPKLPLTESQASNFKNIDNDPRGAWVSSDFTAQGWRPNQMYTITTPGGADYTPPPGRCWGNIEPEFKKLLSDNRMWFGKTGNGRPRVKTFLNETEGVSAWTWWPNSEVGHNQEAKKEINAILGAEASFDTPKPTRLLRRIVQLAGDKDAIFLDSFAGSGTTGHAILELNRADGGNRRFILAEMEPQIAQKITAERVRRVSSGYVKPDGTAVAALGGGFRYFKLGETIFSSDGTINPAITFPQLARHVWFEATREPLPATAKFDSPLLGVSRHGTAYYLLFNGILKDKSVAGGNILTRRLLVSLPLHEGPKIIYAAGTRLKSDTLRAEQITFRQTPYQIDGAALTVDSLEEVAQ